MHNLNKNWFVVSKMTRTCWILIWALEILKMSTLIGSVCAKYVTFDLKKYRGVIFHDTEEWWKIWRKTDLWFGKWQEKYGKFSPEHLEVSKAKISTMPLVFPFFMTLLKQSLSTVCVKLATLSLVFVEN